LDYVELTPGDFRFIFMNPKDANYSPPKEDRAGAPGYRGGGDSGS
jgi:iron-sulfur cluster assembly protein